MALGLLTDMTKSKLDYLAMLRAAKAGDYGAARAVLKLHGFGELAAEIKRGLPFSRRVRTMLDAIVAPIGTEWEQDMLLDLPPRRSEAPRVVLFDD